MRAIGVREFRDQATSILAGGETLVIERHGKPIGSSYRSRPRTAGSDATHSADSLGSSMTSSLARAWTRTSWFARSRRNAACVDATRGRHERARRRTAPGRGPDPPGG